MFSDSRDQSHSSCMPHVNPTADARWAVITDSATQPCDDSAHRDVPGALRLHHVPDGHAAPPLTLDRLSLMISPQRTIAIVDGDKADRWRPAISMHGSQLLVQPAGRGTAAPVLLAVSYVLEYDPKATLLIMPPDHAVHPEERFRGYLLRLCLLAELFHDQVVVLGAGPLGPEHDYSWLMPGGIKSPSLWAGAGPNPLGMITYYDRPNGHEALRLFQEGGLLNTGVYAVKVKTLWKIGWETIPGTMRHFDAFRQVLRAIRTDQAPPTHESPAIHHLYQNLETIDLSADLFQRAADNLTVLPMDDVSWSDRRSPERMRQVMERASAPSATRPWPIKIIPHEVQPR